MDTHQFSADNLIHIVRLIQHDLAQQHVLKCSECAHILNAIVALERLIEVGESGLEVTFIGCVEDARLQVKCGLHLGRTVDRVGGGAG